MTHSIFKPTVYFITGLAFLLIGSAVFGQNKKIKKQKMTQSHETAVFAGGCFWCTEALFLELDGVISIKPGYCGGSIPHPTYEAVCTGNTGHAEAVEIQFDSSKISFASLLQVFFATHDPTTLNRQGNDAGTQYRSAVFYQNEGQRNQTKAYIEQLTKAHTFKSSIVTQVVAASVFYEAEDYHKNYYNRNKDKGYCEYVITPKVAKVQHQFKSLLKK